MSQIDVIKEMVRYEQLLRESSTNHVLKGEYLIRDSQYPDMKEVLGVDAKSTITNKEVLGDKIMVEGTLNYIVFYLPKDEALMEGPMNRIHSVIFTDKFTNYLDLNNDEHNVWFDVECEIEHIEANWMNERKVGIDGVITLNWEIYKNGEFEYVEDIEGKDDIQTLKKEEVLTGIKGEKEIDLMAKAILKVSMDKPPIDEILKCMMTIHKKEIKVVEDKFYVGCYCKINILYKSYETNELICIQDDVYLSKEEELPGISSDMFSLTNLCVKNYDCMISEDDLGENRVVNVELLIKGNIKVYDKDNVEMLKDAYSPTMNLELKKENKSFGDIHSIASSETVVKDNIKIKNDEDRIEEIVYVSSNPFILEKHIKDDRVKIDGVIKLSIIYKIAGEELRYGILVDEIPFNTSVDVRNSKSEMDVIVRACLESIDSTIEGNSIAVRANLGFLIKVCYKRTVEVLVDAIETEGSPNEKKASITIYVVGEKDTLWDLAKKYNTTIEELRKINELDMDEEVKMGGKIIIPGRAMF
ncbi:SPOCS domain-containing protein [Clostridium sp.]|uniref:DUF3794 and LysM peptidoglycan-binding domain-containing protein n=1 Tax=Clostridium sp. TaxID=1506 RepID=UPI00262DA26C|nr:SPOCS domain-containing protein [Clostridium sp.]